MDKPQGPATSRSTKQPGTGPSNEIEPRRAAPVWVRPLATIFLWAAAIWLFLHFFDTARLILLGVLAAACVAATVRPLVRHIPGPRPLAGVLAGLVPLVVSGVAVGLTVWLLVKPIQRQIKDWPHVQERLDKMLAGLSHTFGLSNPVTVEGAAAQVGRNLADFGFVLPTATVVEKVFMAMVFVFIGAIYLLTDPPGTLTRPVIALFPPRRRSQLQGALDDLDPRLRWWAIGTLVNAVAIGFTSWLAYIIIGLDFAAPLAVLAGLSEFTPNIGPLVMWVLAVIIAASHGVWQVIAVTVAYILIHILESYILVPWVMRRAVEMPPFVTLFTIVLWGEIFGIAGLFLALPINLVIWSFVDHFIIKPQAQPATD